MLPSAAQPLSVRGRARYEGNDSVEGLQETAPSQVCCPLPSADPQASLTTFPRPAGLHNPVYVIADVSILCIDKPLTHTGY